MVKFMGFYYELIQIMSVNCLIPLSIVGEQIYLQLWLQDMTYNPLFWRHTTDIYKAKPIRSVQTIPIDRMV